MSKVRQLKPENGKKEALGNIHHEFVMCITRLAFLEQVLQETSDNNVSLDGDRLCGLVGIIRDIKKDVQVHADALDKVDW
jgi:hypothetical protein